MASNTRNPRLGSGNSSQDFKFGSSSYVQPPAKVLVDGYKSTLNYTNGASARQSAASSRRSKQWNSNDPVSMHLLMETAMGDSQKYEVLLPEEIDDLKKQLSILSSRIDSTKRKLVLETKVRDATQSISRLNTSKGRDESIGPSTNGQKRQQKIGSKASVSGAAARSEEEAVESAQKCDDLAQELWILEKQEQELSRRLLEHTAGILQLTHKGYVRNMPTEDELRKEHGINGIDALGFGDLSHYRPYSQTGPKNNLDNEDAFSSNAEFAQQTKMILAVEEKVEDLNARLRDMILELKPRKEDLPQPPRELRDDPTNVEQILWEQIDFLDQCLNAMNTLQKGAKGNPTPGFEEGNIAEAIEEKLETCNTQLFQLMTQSNPEQASKYSPPPEASGRGLRDQLDYLGGGLGAVSSRLRQLGELADTSSAKLVSYQERAEKYVSVIGNLWDMLAASEQPKQRSADSGYPNNIEDDFSLQAFAEKIRELNARSTDLQIQKDVLTRQVQQQRSLNETGESAKDAMLTDTREELDQTKIRLEAMTVDSRGHMEKLTTVTAELDAAQLALSSQDQQRSIGMGKALKEEEALRERAELELQRVKLQLQESKDSAAVMQLNVLTLKSDLEAKAQTALNADGSLRELEGEVARLQTELTFAKAELDGVYGSKAQRAAEQAGDPKLLKEREALQVRVKTLQNELTETIVDYEAMTKATIEYEREREQLESLVDGLRDRIGNLEGQLADERVQMLGAKSPGGSSTSGAVNTTSAGVLKNEFKKMMKETRTEHAKAIKAEQDERRRLEGILRTMKKEQPLARLAAK